MGDAYNKSVYICLLFLSKAICWSVCLVLLVPRVQIIGLTTNVFIFRKFVYFCSIKSSRHRWGPTMGASNNTWKNGWYSYMLAFRVSVFCWSILFLLNLLSDSLLGTGFDQPACLYKCTSVLALNEFLKKKCILCLFQYLI